MFPGKQSKAIRRTASDLKSSATARPGQLPHKTHMRLVCLEMERYRKARERESLLARAARCEERCAAIDVEVRMLMANLARLRPMGGHHAEVKAPVGLSSAVAKALPVNPPATHTY